MDRRLDILLSLTFIALGVFVIVAASTISTGIYRDPVGPRAFFYGCAAMFILGGMATIGQRLMSWRSEPGNIVEAEGSEDEAGHPASAARAGLLILSTLVYAWLLQPLGYLIATPLFIAATLVLLRVRGVVKLAAISLIFTLVAYLVFAQLLEVRIPVGPFTTWFREMGWIIL